MSLIAIVPTCIRNLLLLFDHHRILVDHVTSDLDSDSRYFDDLGELNGNIGTLSTEQHLYNKAARNIE